MTVQPDEACGELLHSARGIRGGKTERIEFVRRDKRRVENAESAVEDFAVGGNREAVCEPLRLRQAARPFESIASALAENGAAQNQRLASAHDVRAQGRGELHVQNLDG